MYWIALPLMFIWAVTPPTKHLKLPHKDSFECKHFKMEMSSHTKWEVQQGKIATIVEEWKEPLGYFSSDFRGAMNTINFIHCPTEKGSASEVPKWYKQIRHGTLKNVYLYKLWLQVSEGALRHYKSDGTLGIQLRSKYTRGAHMRLEYLLVLPDKSQILCLAWSQTFQLFNSRRKNQRTIRMLSNEMRSTVESLLSTIKLEYKKNH